MERILTKEIAYNVLQEICQQKLFVLFGTGTSCAVDRRFGMPALQTHLLEKVPKYSLNSGQLAEWSAVVQALEEKRDLESAMDKVQDSELTQHIVNETANLLVELDRIKGLSIITGEIMWPPISLFTKLINGLPESDRILHVATPNYDLLAEYALEKAGISYSTGFVGGVCRRVDWKQVDREMTYHEPVLRKGSGKVAQVSKTKNHIRLYKVHGSLNTFRVNSSIIENNAWMCTKPNEIERLMITPGTSKHRLLHQNRTELLGVYDQALDKHSAFLFIGFGFNDSQLCNDAILRKLREQKCHGLIITRDSNSRIESLLRECSNLWLVCKEDGSGEGTRIYNGRYSNWLIISEKQLWNAHEFTNEILGG